MKPESILAFVNTPDSPLHEYSASDLDDPNTVSVLFDYCQILQGAITAEGWRHLLRHHGVPAVLEIAQRSGWFDEDDNRESLKYECLIAGYDPQSDSMGRYDEDSGIFTNAVGERLQIRWGVRWQSPFESTDA